jgi:abhydrolase domain-containing protein 6
MSDQQQASFAKEASWLTTALVDSVMAMQRWWNGLVWKTAHDVDGYDWPYLEGGDASASQVVILLHGFGGEKSHWVSYAPAFIQTGQFRIIIPDLLGFGDNARPTGLSFRVSEQSKRLHAFVCRVAGPSAQVHVAGNSMGGKLAIQYALDRPDRVASLCLQAPAGLKAPEPSDLEKMFHSGDKYALVISKLSDVDRLLNMVTFKPLPVSAGVKAVIFDRAKPREEFLKKVIDDLIVDTVMNDLVAGIQCPTLILWGKHDRLLHVSGAEILKRSIKRNRCVIYDSMGSLSNDGRSGGNVRRAHFRFLADVAANKI